MLSGVLELADMALAFAILGGLIAVLILYVLDVNQTSQAIGGIILSLAGSVTFLSI